MCTAGQSDVGLLIETAFAIHLADGSSSSSEVVLGIWKTAQQLKSEADKAGRANKVKVVGFACSPTCFRQNWDTWNLYINIAYKSIQCWLVCQAVRGAPLSLHDLRLVLSSCQAMDLCVTCETVFSPRPNAEKQQLCFWVYLQEVLPWGQALSHVVTVAVASVACIFPCPWCCSCGSSRHHQSSLLATFTLYPELIRHLTQWCLFCTLLMNSFVKWVIEALKDFSHC